MAVSVEAVYVRSTHTYLRESPEVRAKNLLKLEKGEAAIVLNEQGYWRQIRVRGQTGWVSHLSLVESEQFTKLSNLEFKKKTKDSRQNIRLRMASAAVGVKGLRSSQVEKIEENYNLEALKTMESFVADEVKAAAFVLDYTE
jgi:uncharacterized protein YgiM (DUF1202 family)